MSYTGGVSFMGAHIIDLNTGKDILNDNNSYFYVNGFEKEKGILKIDTNGLDNNGRYWKKGTYNLKTKVCQFGKKEY